MIRNLNQVTFQGFGTVPPERSQSAKGFDRSTASTLPLSQTEAVVFRADSDTWLTNGTGSSVLSVSLDGQQYQDYYLDKPVCVKSGVYFCVSPFLGPASARMSCAQAPAPVGKRSADSQRVHHQLQVDALEAERVKAEPSRGWYRPE